MKTRERRFNLFNDGAAARGRRRGRRFDHRTKDNLFLRDSYPAHLERRGMKRFRF